MMNRCYTTTNKDYPAMGGSGITVCNAWHTYETFVEDMGNKPENSQLARYCEGLGFTKENTYWMQKLNTRSNRLYSIWKGIRRRCGYTGKISERHKSYGYRGIDMSADWVNDFIQFSQDVGQPPSDEHTLDRINNNLGYFPNNIRWATKKEQANNRSDNIVIEMFGERRTLQEWGDYYGVDRQTVSSRWNALFTEAKRKNSPCTQYTMLGEKIKSYSGIKEAAAETGIKQGTIAKCLSGGNASAGGFLWRYDN